jgi:phosphoglycerate dehydrogenase-like enzyme
MKPLTIWSNFDLLTEEQIVPHRRTNSIEQAEIAFGQPDVEQIIRSRSLRWVHISTAGYTKYDREDLRRALKSRGAVMTNSSSVFDEPCAQHVLAMMLAMTRQLPAAMRNQAGPRAWDQDEIRACSSLLRGQKVLLVGFGAIARRLAEMLAPFNVEIIGVRRAPRGDEHVRIVSIDEIERHLPWADHVVNILPLSDSTSLFFDVKRIARMKSTALFYSIGRGRTVDQDALRAALQSNQIAGAYLDVMTPEPLPENDPLWTTPNCYITPHTGGGHTGERERQLEHFLENVRRFDGGQPLADRIV